MWCQYQFSLKYIFSVFVCRAGASLKKKIVNMRSTSQTGTRKMPMNKLNVCKTMFLFLMKTREQKSMAPIARGAAMMANQKKVWPLCWRVETTTDEREPKCELQHSSHAHIQRRQRGKKTPIWYRSMVPARHHQVVHVKFASCGCYHTTSQTLWGAIC